MITDKEIQLVVDGLMQETENSNKGFCLCVIRLLQEIKNNQTTNNREYLITSLQKRGLISGNDKYKLLLELRKEKDDSIYCVCSEPTTHSMGALPSDYKKLLTICDVCGFSIKEEPEETTHTCRRDYKGQCKCPNCKDEK